MEASNSQVGETDEAEEADGELSDAAGADSFADSPSFIDQPQIITVLQEKRDSTFTTLWMQLVEIFREQIPELMQFSGLQAIPFLQVTHTRIKGLAGSLIKP